MLDGVEAHILLFAEKQIYRYLQQGHHNNISASIASLRDVSIPPPSPTTLLPMPSLQTTSNNMSTSEEVGYSEKAGVFHAPNLDAHETGRARSRSRDSRRGEPPEAGSDDETEDGAPYLHPDPPTKRFELPVRAETKTD